MKNRINKYLKVSLGLFAILILVILTIDITYERIASKNIVINISKRILAEGGAFVSRLVLKDDNGNKFSFGPIRNPEINLSDKDIVLEDSFDKSIVRYIKNFKISEFAKNFQYENFNNPKLQILQEKYKLEELISKASTELDKIIILREWVRKKIPLGIPKNVDYNFNALDILARAEKGEGFFCSEYSTVFIQCAAAVGLIARYVGLFKGHAIAEIWSNQFEKWIVMDVNNNMHYENEGVPLSALELHDIWESKNFSNIKIIKGIERKILNDDEKEYFLSYYHEFYIRMRNDWFSNRYPHWHHKGNSIINSLEWQDKYTSNNILVARETSNAEQLYFLLNVVSLSIKKEKSTIAQICLTLDTFTPNFSNFIIRFDDDEPFIYKNHELFWGLHKGKNKLEVYSVNNLGVKGPSSKIELII